MKPKRSVDAFMADLGYLPKELRDFHAQKDLFKTIHGTYKSGDTFNMPTWVDGHIYAVDYFLWFMAKHGYTLRKSRANVEFQSLKADVDEYIKQLRATFALTTEATPTVKTGEGGTDGSV